MISLLKHSQGSLGKCLLFIIYFYFLSKVIIFSYSTFALINLPVKKLGFYQIYDVMHICPKTQRKKLHIHLKNDDSSQKHKINC